MLGATTFSRDAVAANMGRMIDFYNEQVEQYQAIARRLSPVLISLLTPILKKLVGQERLKKI